MKNSKFIAAAAAAFSISAGGASAATLTVDAGWDTVVFSTVEWLEDFTFTIASTAYLYVTDFQAAGDMFEVFSGVASLGTTSSVPASSPTYTLDIDAAYASADFSSAVYTFGAGSYTISGLMAQSATGFTSGRVAAQLSSTAPAAVPLPATGILLLAALGAGAFSTRRRNKVA